MKKCLSVLLIATVVLCTLPACADTMYCPYCGKKTDSSYSFCPSCGKSLKGVGNGEQPQQPYSSSAYVPGFYHTASELLSIINSLCSNPTSYRNKPVSSFPIRMSVDLTRRDGLTSMNWPQNLNQDKSSRGIYWMYSLDLGRFFEKGDGDAFFTNWISYSYSVSRDGSGDWCNSIGFTLKNSGAVNQADITFYSDRTLWKEEISICTDSPKRIITFLLYRDGHIGCTDTWY